MLDPNPVPSAAAPQRVPLAEPAPGAPSAPRLGALGPLGWVIFAWSVGGVGWLLGRAVARLGQVAADALLRHPLDRGQVVFLVLWVAFMGYAEGYRELQRRFAPRIVRRAFHLAAHPTILHALLGPAFAMGLVHATRRRLLTSWIVVSGIVVLVVVVRQAPQPWRGLIDCGVVVGLTWGIIGLAVEVTRLFRGRAPAVALDLPLTP